MHAWGYGWVLAFECGLEVGVEGHQLIGFEEGCLCAHLNETDKLRVSPDSCFGGVTHAWRPCLCISRIVAPLKFGSRPVEAAARIWFGTVRNLSCPVILKNFF